MEAAIDLYKSERLKDDNTLLMERCYLIMGAEVEIKGDLKTEVYDEIEPIEIF